MLPRLVRACVLVVALAAPLVACIDEAGNCYYTYNCPPPDAGTEAGDGGDASMDANTKGD